VVFASTTGDLPIPDKQGFLDWIKAGMRSSASTRRATRFMAGRDSPRC